MESFEWLNFLTKFLVLIGFSAGCEVNRVVLVTGGAEYIGSPTCLSLKKWGLFLFSRVAASSRIKRRAQYYNGSAKPLYFQNNDLLYPNYLS